MRDERTLRLGLLIELRGDVKVLKQSEIVRACSSEDTRTRELGQLVGAKRWMQIVHGGQA